MGKRKVDWAGAPKEMERKKQIREALIATAPVRRTSPLALGKTPGVTAEEVKAITEVALRAAARDYAEACDSNAIGRDTEEEDAAAQTLFDAALAYAWRDGDG